MSVAATRTQDARDLNFTTSLAPPTSVKRLANQIDWPAKTAATIYCHQENKVRNKHSSLMNLYAACELAVCCAARGER